MPYHNATYHHDGLPVYVFPAVDCNAESGQVDTIACPFLDEYPHLHSKSGTHKRKVFSNVGCGGFPTSMVNHARDKTACGRMFKKPCFLQAAEGPLKLYDPKSVLEDDKENKDPRPTVAERKAVDKAKKVIRHLEAGVKDIFIKAISQDAAMDLDGNTLLSAVTDIVQDRENLTAQKNSLEQDVHNLSKMRSKLLEIRCDCPKLETELAQTQNAIGDLHAKLDSRKYSYAEQAAALQELFAAAKGESFCESGNP